MGLLKVSLIVIVIAILNLLIINSITDELESGVIVTVKVDYNYTDYSVSNKTVVLSNIDNNKVIFKKTNRNNKFGFNPEELVDDFKKVNLIKGYICLLNDQSYSLPDGYHIQCKGYHFYFPLFKDSGNHIDMTFHNLFTTLTRKQEKTAFNVSGYDKNLYFCSVYVYKPDSTLMFKKDRFINFTRETCDFTLIFNKSTLPEGSYFLGLYGSDTLNQGLEIYSFYQRDIEIENPYIVPADIIVDLTNTSCYFKDGSQIYLINSSNPLQKIIKPAICYNQKDVGKPPIITYRPIYNLVNLIIPIVGGIVGSLIAYTLIFPNTTRGRRIFITIVVFIVILVLLYILQNIIPH